MIFNRIEILIRNEEEKKEKEKISDRVVSAAINPFVFSH